MTWAGWRASKYKGEMEERGHKVCPPPPAPIVSSFSRYHYHWYGSTPDVKGSGLGQSSPSPGSDPSVSSHLSTGPGCQALRVEGGPPSLTVNLGEEARLTCENNGRNPNITWWFSLQSNNTWPPMPLGPGQGTTGQLFFPEVNKSHRGLYWCQVIENNILKRSCGTYLRVRSE